MSSFHHPQPGLQPTGIPCPQGENTKVPFLSAEAIVRFSYTFPCIALFESELLIKYEKLLISQTSMPQILKMDICNS